MIHFHYHYYQNTLDMKLDLFLKNERGLLNILISHGYLNQNKTYPPEQLHLYLS